ncbi:MAG TPA: enoyl-CoA hydratase/isomerase family protein [Woeseiaceae bacterium]
MAEFSTVKYATQGATAVITISRPDAMNSFNAELRSDLMAAFRLADTDDGIRVIVFTGEGRSFSAGADLKGSLSIGSTVEQQLQEEYRPVFEMIMNTGKPVIAAVGGSAAGIGMSFALTCDLLIMAESAFLLAPFTTISLVPDGGLNWLLVQQLGYRRAFQLCIESERIPAPRCVELGLANRAVPANDLMTEALAWAESIAERAPLSIAATKKAMRFALENSWGATYDIEAEMQDSLRGSEDCVEGVTAFFEKRKPEFKGK